MTHEDLECLYELTKQLGYDSKIEDFKDRLEKIPSDELLFARDENQKIIGYAHVHEEEPTLLAPPRALLIALVRSNLKREAAHRFYQREGFDIEKTSHTFSKSFD